MATKPITLSARATEKRIYWSKTSNGYTGHAFILVGYCPDTLGYFNAMFQEALKTFPDLDSEAVTVGQVNRSTTVQGFTLLAFHLPVSPTKVTYPGWFNLDGEVDFKY